jgi:hypothetical protein
MNKISKLYGVASLVLFGGAMSMFVLYATMLYWGDMHIWYDGIFDTGLYWLVACGICGAIAYWHQEMMGEHP